MKHVVLFLTVGLLGLGAGCRSVTEPSRGRSFVIQVSAIDAPEKVGPNDPIPVGFFGTIGPDLCHQLDHFELAYSAGAVDVTAIGSFRSGGACALAISELRGAGFVVAPPHQGSFRIVVHEPDGSTLERVVAVGG